MPSLRIFGHRTFVAGDDLRTFIVLALTLRLVQLAVLIPVTKFCVGAGILDVEITDECANESKVPRLVKKGVGIIISYIALSWFLNVVGTGIEIGMWRTTNKGTPTQPELRWKLRPLCFVKMFPMGVVRIGNLFLGVVSVSTLQAFCACGTGDDTQNCPKIDRWQTYYAVLVGTHFVEAVVATLLAVHFSLKSTPKLPSAVSVSAATKWQFCCKCCCTFTTLLTCCLAGGRDNKFGDFADVAAILADFFDDGGTLDVVASDVMLGLSMMKRVQNQRQLEARNELVRRASVRVLQMPVQHEEPKEGESVVDEEMGVTAPVRTSSKGKIKGSFGRKIQLDETDKVLQDKNEEGEDIDNTSYDFDGTDSSSENEGLDQFEGDSIEDDEEEETEMLKLALFDIDENDTMLQLDSSAKAVLREINKKDKKRTYRGRESIVYNARQEGRRILFSPSLRAVLSPKDAMDKLAIAEGARFMRFAAGIYLFKEYAENLQNLLFGCTDASRRLRIATTGDILKLRNITGWKADRLAELAGLDQDTDLVYVQFHQGVARTPYCIVIDHAWKSIVISIRGTLSLDDVVADLTLKPMCMAEWGDRCGFDGRDYYVHAGMLKCSEWIYNDLERHGILEKLLLREDSAVAGYELRLTGHSLGAGSAAILSFMMKNKYPNLRCLCFCPPGCTLSGNMAESCKDYLTSYVLDSDIVPRLSLQSVEHLRDGALEMIARVKVTKNEAFHAKPSREQDDPILCRKASIPPSKFVEQLDEFHAHRRRLKAERGSMSYPLYPPGKIVQLVRTEDEEPSSSCLSCNNVELSQQNRQQCAPLWVFASDLAEIDISSHFLDDHKSDNVLGQLEKTAEHFGLSPPFVIDDQGDS